MHMNYVKRIINSLSLLKKISNINENVKQVLIEQKNINNNLDVLKILSAQNLINYNKNSDLTGDIRHAEFKVFSQWGDDGIIQYIINKIEFTKTFIEFGVQNYTESNTRFLLMNDNWSGLIIDGSEENIRYIKNDPIFWKYDLKAINCFITKKNINEVIKQAGFENEIGILSIDIDGNDYWIWETITIVNPIMVVIEFNAVFGSDRKISTPYSDNFIRENEHFSYLYFGASLPALIELGKQKGFSFIGTNSDSVNAYFLRNDCLNNFTLKTTQHSFSNSKFRESRDASGQLNYLSFEERQNCIKGLPVINLETNSLEKF